MATISLTPLLDALGGTTSIPATFQAVAMQAGKYAVRVDGSTVTFPTALICNWNGTQWDTPPQLEQLPTGCYWSVTVWPTGTTPITKNVIVATNVDPVDFGDLQVVTPDTATPDESTVSGYQAAILTNTQIAQNIATVAAQVTAAIAGVQPDLDQVPTDLQSMQSFLVAAQSARDTAVGAAAAAPKYALISATGYSALPNPDPTTLYLLTA